MVIKSLTGHANALKKISLTFLLLFLGIILNTSAFAQYTKLKITINAGDNLHLQEVEWMVNTTAYPDVDMTANNSGGYIASSDPVQSNAFRAFDGTTDKIYIGNNVPYVVTLELSSAITPTSVRIQKPGWSGLSDFTCEGFDGSTWVELAHIQNPDNWSDFGEFTLSAPQDTEAPTVPTNLSASDISQTSLNLSWNAASDNVGVTEYEVFKDGNSIGTTAANSFSVTGLNASTTYSFTVAASDAAGNTSAQSAALDVTTAGVTYSYLKIDITGADNLHLQEVEWIANGTTYPTYDLTSNTSTDYIASSNKAGGGAYRAFDGTTDKVYVGANTPYDVVLELVNTDISPTSVRIQKPGWSGLSAFTIEGSNDGSNWTTLLTVNNPDNWSGFGEFIIDGSQPPPQDTEAPTTPGNLSASNITQTSTDLSWDAATDNVGVSGYEIYQDGNSLGTTSNTSFSVSGLTASTTYQFSVEAFDDAGNYSSAATVNITTQDNQDNCTASGTILFEKWDGISGTSVDDLRNSSDFPNNPSSSSEITSFETNTNVDDYYGARIIGYICAPETGDYTFWIAADDNCELWLSTDDNPSNAIQIAGHTSWTSSREWDKYSSQQSNAISLQAGQSYFIEALMKEHGGGDNLAVGWSKPGESTSAPSEVIPGSVLSPFASAPQDTEAPTTPTNLSTSNTTQTSTDLSWDAATDNVGVSGYEIYQDGNSLGTTSNTSFSVSGLTASTTYQFSVEAFDDAGNYSSAATINVTTTNPVTTDDKKVAAINLHWVKDYLPPILADVFQTNREWEGPAYGSGAISLDQNGWPNEDAGCVVWHGYEHKSGTYRLIFEGQADVSWEWASGVSIENKSYNSSTNTTTADLVFSQKCNAFRIKFTNTNGGVKNIKLLRPISEGSSTYHNEDEVIDREMKAIISKFKVVRYMDPGNINSNPETTWSDRRLPGAGYINRTKYNPYAYKDNPTSIPWEYIVKIANETGTDPWICIPAMVDDDYVTKVAQIFKYGSDGVNPYTSTQSNPVWEPLNSDLNLYVEYSNEVWNSGNSFRQHHYNLDAAKTAVTNNLNHPLNFDDLVTSTADVENKGYDFAKRRVAWKAAEISKIFRNIFGDSQMMNRIRPLFLWQISNTGINSWGLSGLNFADAYYRQAESNDVNYYFWGGGPAGYYSPADDATIDNVWDSNDMNPVPWADNKVEYDGRLNAAFGMKFVLYEGGPGFGDALGGAGSTPVGEEAWNDSRIYNEMDEHHTAYNQKGGELFCYYVLHHDFRWTFLHEGTANDDTYKMQYMEDMQLENRAAVTVGYQVPVSLNGGQFDAIKAGWKLNNSGQQNPDGPYKLVASNKEWISYRLLSNENSTFYITVDYKTSETSKLEIIAGGDLLTELDIPNTGGAIQSTSSFAFSMPAEKLYAVRLRVTGNADITIDKVDITYNAKKIATEGNVLTAKQESLQKMHIYPNPVENNAVQVEIPLSFDVNSTAQIMLFDLSGKQVINLETDKSLNSIDVSGLNKGLYIMKVKYNQKQHIEKLIVK